MGSPWRVPSSSDTRHKDRPVCRGFAGLDLTLANFANMMADNMVINPALLGQTPHWSKRAPDKAAACVLAENEQLRREVRPLRQFLDENRIAVRAAAGAENDLVFSFPEFSGDPAAVHAHLLSIHP